MSAFRVRAGRKTCGHEHSSAHAALLCLQDLTSNRCSVCSKIDCDGAACGGRRVCGWASWYTARIVTQGRPGARWRGLRADEARAMAAGGAL